MDLNELAAKRDRIRAELETQKGDYERSQDPGTLERLGNLKRGLEAVEHEILDAAMQNPGQREDGSHTPGFRVPESHDRSPGGQDRDAALRVVEERSDELAPAAADRLDEVIRADRFGIDSRYVTAISSPEYLTAFGKRLLGRDGAEAMLTPEEGAAMQAVGASMAERAMVAGTGELGGYAVPLSLDPTVLLTSDGAINPVRELATVTPITSTTWQGVSSAGVKAVFTAEATEAKDAEPKFAAPEITPEKAQIWIPYSIEIGQDWAGLAAELAKLFADARDTKEAEVFATGKGEEHIPQGLTVGATKLVETAAKEVVAAADIYSLQEALPPRWQARATWLGANKVANQIYRFVAQGDTEEPRLMSEARDSILGKPYRELSTMSSKTTTKKERVLAYGDIGAAYRVVDRLGMTVETVPLVLGEKGAPTGQRGAYCYFRVGAKVIVPEALRVLAVKE